LYFKRLIYNFKRSYLLPAMNTHNLNQKMIKWIAIAITVVFLFSVLNSIIANGWEKLEGPYGGSFCDFYANDTIMLACVEGAGLYISSDFGFNWNLLRPEYYVSSCVTVRENYIYTAIQSNIFRSGDMGISWEEFDSGIPQTSLGLYKLVSDNDRIFLYSGAGLFMNQSNDTIWHRIYYDEITPEVFCVAVHKDSILIAAVYSGICVSSDFGLNWTQSDLEMSAGAIISNDSVIYASGNDGVYCSIDDGLTWVERNEGLDESMRDLCFFENHVLGIFDQVYILENFGPDWK